jgi:hypothetical protein
MYRSTFSWPRHQLQVSGQFVSLTPPLPGMKEPPIRIGQEVGRTPEPVWRSENYLLYLDSNSDLSVVQPVASRYTDYATAVHNAKA